MDKAFELKPNTLGEVPLALLDPDPEQPRKDFDEDYITNELAPSIKKDGVIQPIVVRTNPEQPGRFFIVAGENRWRASKAAKLKTIPAVLREVEGLSKLLIQLKENHQRRELNPMEWALALQSMNKVHGLKQADIEKTLKESGVGQFGRSYISNMIRLLELPEWAQALIRHNAITASHGKYLLQAMSSEPVMEAMREMLESGEYFPTTADIQRDIYWKFQKFHVGLNSHGTPFDYREVCVKTGCQKMRKASNGAAEETFCLDKECHAIMVTEHRRAEKERLESDTRESDPGAGESAPREIVVSDDNRVDVDAQQLNPFREYRTLEHADFDTADCQQCKHRHIAVRGDDTDRAGEDDSCFLVICYLEKDAAARRARTLLKKWLVKKVGEKVRSTEGAGVRLLAWIAACLPSVTTSDEGEEIEYEWQDMPDEVEDFESKLFALRLTGLRQFLSADNESMASLAAYAVGMFDSQYARKMLFELVEIFGVSIDSYQIDEDYLGEHTEAELVAWVESLTLSPGLYAEFSAAQQLGHLDKFILTTAAPLLGVPAVIRSAWNAMFKEGSHD